MITHIALFKKRLVIMMLVLVISSYVNVSFLSNGYLFLIRGVAGGGVPTQKRLKVDQN